MASRDKSKKSFIARHRADKEENTDDVKVYQKGDYHGNSTQKDSRRRWKNANFISSFEFAVSGIVTAFKEERNFRKHFVSSILIIIAGVLFRVTKEDWLWLALAIGLVIAGELFNSAIENVVDLASDYNFHMRAKRSKDMAAGAVLIISLFAVIVGLIVFVPRIWALVQFILK